MGGVRVALIGQFSDELSAIAIEEGWELVVTLEGADGAVFSELNAAARAWVEAGGAALLLPSGPTHALPELELIGASRSFEVEIGDLMLMVGGFDLKPREGAKITWWVHANDMPDFAVAARVELGRGHVLVLRSEQLMGGALQSDDEFAEWTDRVVTHWLPSLHREQLSARMRKPQRHRLLQAFPMAPVMAATGKAIDFMLQRGMLAPSRDRAAVVGVLPHAHCNPAVKGCGFCTFPHEPYSRERTETVGAHVAREIRAFRTRLSSRKRPGEWPRRAIEALYLGGGTANLTPEGTFREIAAALDETFVLDGAEVTFEGVPLYFIARKPSPLDLLRECFPRSRPRISLGI
jgi:hypothetical protein